MSAPRLGLAPTTAGAGERTNREAPSRLGRPRFDPGDGGGRAIDLDLVADAATEQLLHSFADKVGATNGVIWQYTRFQGTIDQAINANKEENETITDRLARLEKTLEKQREMYQKIFANLESTMSRMQSTSDALLGILSGLPSRNR